MEGNLPDDSEEFTSLSEAFSLEQEGWVFYGTALVIAVAFVYLLLFLLRRPKILASLIFFQMVSNTSSVLG